MKEYFISLKDRKEIAEGTMAFLFQRPPELEFKAGQYLDFTLIDPPFTDTEGNMRTFSIASSPHERDKIMIATRIRESAFKKNLREFPLGTKVRVEGPFGSFILHKNEAKPAVFLAGGIGVTPFRSITHWATSQKLSHKIFLFFSNRTHQSSIFLNEFEAWQRENKNFKLVATMTDEAPLIDEYEHGQITPEMIKKYLPEINGPIYYIAGPQGMVAAMRDILTSMNIDEDDIRTEEFSGY